MQNMAMVMKNYPQVLYRIRGGSRNLGGGGGGGTGRGWVREGDVPPPARSAEALSNTAILTHIPRSHAQWSQLTGKTLSGERGGPFG